GQIVQFAQGWRHVSDDKASGGAAQVADSPGAEATFHFPGRGTRLIATTGPMMGQLDVYVDGRFHSTVDLYSPKIHHKQEVALIFGLENSWHAVTYRVSSHKNAASSGYYCPLDRF